MRLRITALPVLWLGVLASLARLCSSGVSVQLRTGAVSLSESGQQPQRSQQWDAQSASSADAGVGARSEALPSDSTRDLDPLAYRSAAAWGDLPYMRLYLVAYGDSADDDGAGSTSSGGVGSVASVSSRLLRASLRAAGASVLSYIPHRTLLVAALPEAAERVMRQTGATMVEYGPQHRAAPEWGALLVQATGSNDGGGGGGGSDGDVAQKQPHLLERRRRRQRRRRLQQQDQGERWGTLGKAVTAEAEPALVPQGGLIEAVSLAPACRDNVRVGSGEWVDSPVADGGGGDAAAAYLARLGRLRALDHPEAVPGGETHQRRRQLRRRQLGEGESTVLPTQYEVLAELLPVAGLTAAALVAAELDWPAALAAALGDAAAQGDCLPLVAAPRASDGEVAAPAAAGGGAGGPQLRVFVCEQHLSVAVAWLSSQPVVRWVAPRVRVAHRNARADILAQTGDLSLAQYNDPVGASPEARRARRPYWAAGVDGEGEVVGLGDSGVDLDSCYLADPRVNGSAYVGLLRTEAASSTREGNRSLGGGPALRYLPGAGEHRKIAQYWLGGASAWGDDPSSGAGGHGTHTAGSVAGVILAAAGNPAAAAYGPLAVDAGSGAAPRARLSIADIGARATARIPAGALLPPEPLDINYLPIHASVGAAIVSDSWGSEENFYEDYARAFDSYLWRNPDMISFIAAGNNGTDALTLGGSMGAPATSKSPVAVGATVRLPAAASMGYRTLVVRGTNPATGQEAFRLAVYPLENLDMPRLLRTIPFDQEARLVVAEPADACSALTNPAETITGAVVLVVRGECWFYEKVLNVLSAGGSAMVVANNEAFMMDSPPYPVYPNSRYYAASMPVSVVSRGLGDWLLGNVTAGLELSLANIVVSVDTSTVAAFSSYGPMADGRVKPDIVAPGMEIISAGARGGITGGACSSATLTMSGTSMASPLAAGSAALMRQYLRSGFYPTGSPNDTTSSPFTPSGMLLKALIIAGAQSLEGGLALGLGTRMGPPPDGFQGWGRLSLSGSLPLRGHTDGPLALQVADRGQFTATGQELEIGGLKATGTGPITIVLTWYDYPADLNSAIQLVNDLDLIVEVAGGADGSPAVQLLGNSPEAAASPSPDRVNTVERVFISYLPLGALLTLRVRAQLLASTLLDGADARLPQRFAVAAVGHFTGTFVTGLNPAYVRWEALRDRGVIVDGIESTKPPSPAPPSAVPTTSPQPPSPTSLPPQPPLPNPPAPQQTTPPPAPAPSPPTPPSPQPPSPSPARSPKPSPKRSPKPKPKRSPRPPPLFRSAGRNQLQNSSASTSGSSSGGGSSDAPLLAAAAKLADAVEQKRNE